ncbi:histidine phosphatase family protein [Janibacter hoylei]|uniref:histidine phosphatase family protein n=1 Tax=Janibacter hoylei TaxID=364298 RepID=UPI002492FAEB|nr:histidine phosphatase family protein [Janibacter hoylei]
MRLLLIRHGQTPHNVTGALDTAYPGAGLTELGQRQAAAVPASLADEDVSAVYASPLVRTQLTGVPLAQERSLEVRVREGLEEIAAGDFEMRADQVAVEGYLGGLAAWLHRDLDHAVPGGTTGHDFMARFDGAVRSIAGAHGRDDTVALFSHGAAIRVFATLAAELDADDIEGRWINNTGLVLLDGRPGEGWDLVRWTGDPLGGAHLASVRAHDVTGEAIDEELD